MDEDWLLGFSCSFFFLLASRYLNKLCFKRSGLKRMGMGRGRGAAESAVIRSEGTRELVEFGYRFESMLSQERGDCYLLGILQDKLF